jgi:phosphoglycerate dehydrogenase-like enzyme
MTTTTGTLQLLMLDPMPESEIEFVNGFLPENTFNVVAPDPDGNSDLDELLQSADILVTKGQPVTEELLAKAPNLKLVQKYGGRPDRLDLDAARKANVNVALMPLCGCIAVAELAMTMILALSKQLIDAHHTTKTGAYRELGLEPFETSQRKHAFQWMKLPNLQEIRRKTLGIVGFGEIGTEVAKRARAFEMDVIYYKRDPLPTSIEESLGVTRKPLGELMADSDFITIHVPHGPGTDPLIGAAEISKMKPSAYLVNSSRGPVVDEAALIEALKSKSIAGAGLDVFDYEPLPYDNPLTELDNVILAPHIGGGTGGAREKQMRDVLDNVIRFANGEKPLNQIV